MQIALWLEFCTSGYIMWLASHLMGQRLEYCCAAWTKILWKQDTQCMCHSTYYICITIVCHGKTSSITFWICVSVASVIRNSKEMCRIMSSVARLTPPHFSTFLINCTILGKKLLNIKGVLWFSVWLLPKTFLILRSTEQDMIINVYWSSCKITIIVVRF
jgi:hypothetical protein